MSAAGIVHFLFFGAKVDIKLEALNVHITRILFISFNLLTLKLLLIHISDQRLVRKKNTDSIVYVTLTNLSAPL